MTRHPCHGRSRRSVETFEAIAVGIQDRHPTSTLLALLRHGLIRLVEMKAIGSDRFGVIYRPIYEVPVPVHYQWCRWASENVTDEEMAA